MAPRPIPPRSILSMQTMVVHLGGLLRVIKRRSWPAVLFDRSFTGKKTFAAIAVFAANSKLIIVNTREDINVALIKAGSRSLSKISPPCCSASSQ
jgi:hypothetical protein